MNELHAAAMSEATPDRHGTHQVRGRMMPATGFVSTWTAVFRAPTAREAPWPAELRAALGTAVTRNTDQAFRSSAISRHLLR